MVCEHMVLQAIRERLTGFIAIFILSLLIIPFAFVGVSSYFTSNSLNNIALVNDQPISLNDFNQSFSRYRLRMQRMLGNSFDPVAYDQPIIRREHLDGMIDQELVRQVSVESGLSVADDRLAEAIRDVTSFQVDGVFNAEVYQASLQANALTPQDYENQIRSSMILNQYPQTIAGSSIVTNRELDEYVRLQEQKRTFIALLVPVEEIPLPPEDEDPAADPEADAALETEDDDSAADGEQIEVAEPLVSDEDLLAHYDDHQGDFLIPERVIIEYIELDAASIEGIVEPDEDALRGRFDEQKARFITPEARLTSHILINADPTAGEDEIEAARVQAQGLSDQAREGADFAELAIEFSQDEGSAALGGDLDWVEPTIMVQAFETALYELTMDQPISEPVQTGFGWHVIQLREIRPAEGMSFEEAREIIEAEYREEAEERRFIEQADRMVDLIYEDPTTLEAAADELALEIQVAGPFGRAGGDGVATNQSVVRAAWSDLVFLQGSVSDPIDLDTNHMVMLRVREHLPESVPPLEEIRDLVTTSVLTQRANESARDRAEALLVRVEAGETLSDLAASESLELLENEAAPRTGGGLRRDLQTELFAMQSPAEGAVINEIIGLDDGYAVLQLSAVEDGKLEEGEVLREQNFRLRIANSIANQEALAFIRMLRSQSNIEVFEEKL